MLYLVGRKEVRREKKEGFEKGHSEGMPVLGNCLDLEGSRKGPWRCGSPGKAVTLVGQSKVCYTPSPLLHQEINTSFLNFKNLILCTVV